ncbi:phage T7 F exclusion suppressor FxsA [mine drainage metagenome]|uniref:Phage T7 F exclusion suppressor FxsA n=1 Tax=mine drainage metagenome TaxID=410659 RepID=A0A1J5QFN2_9ZZZZ
MWLFALFVALPLIEIALFVSIGGWLGLGLTLAFVLASAILGMSVIRKQGALTMMDLRRSLSEMRDPARPAAESALVLLAGGLLIVPGFLTSAVGLLLLIPPLRHGLINWASRRMAASGVIVTRQTRQTYSETRFRNGETIDGDFQEIEPPKPPKHQPLGWTRH